MTLAPALALIIASSHGQATNQQAPPPPVPVKAAKRILPFKPAETIGGLLGRHGFSHGQIAQINRLNLLPKGLSLAHGESYRLLTSADGKFAEIKIYEATRDLAYIFWRNGAAVGALTRAETYRVRERRVRGKVHGSLLASIMRVLPHEWIAHRFMDAYHFDFNLPRQLQSGAPFEFRVETKWDGPDLIGYGEILETAIEIGGRLERRHYVRYPGGGTFVDPQDSLRERPLYSPVNYMRISSLFENRRYHPIKQRRQAHLGVDFELPEGTDIFAAEAGVVLRSGFQRASGKFIVIRHNNGLESYYNHLLKISHNIFPGARVQNGQKIGEIGCTGYCTKAHLHFAVKRLGRFVDPMRYLRNYSYRSAQIVSQFREEL